MIPEDLRYTEQHEWVRLEKGGVAVVGITHFAQDQLGDVVYVDLPEAGTALVQHQPFGSIDSVKTASDLFSPVSGETVEVNAALADDPALVNTDPYGQGWMLRVHPADPVELDSLLTAEQYAAFTGAG